MKITAQTLYSGYFWGAVKPKIFPLLCVMDLFVNLNDKKVTLLKICIYSRTSNNIISFSVVHNIDEIGI